MRSEKWFFRTIEIGSALELCFRFLDSASKIREFTSGNTKLSAQDFSYEDESLGRLFSKPHFSLSVSELYDLAFLALYEQEMEKRSGKSGALRIITDIQDTIAKDPVKSEEFFCDGGIAFGETSEDGYMPVQNVKVISSELKNRSVEDEAIRLIKIKKNKRERYPPICALVVSIIANHSDIDYKKILTGVENVNFQKMYFIEHYDAMKEATVVSIEPNTMKVDRELLTIRPTLTLKSYTTDREVMNEN